MVYESKAVHYSIGLFLTRLYDWLNTLPGICFDDGTFILELGDDDTVTNLLLAAYRLGHERRIALTHAAFKSDLTNVWSRGCKQCKVKIESDPMKEFHIVFDSSCNGTGNTKKRIILLYPFSAGYEEETRRYMFFKLERAATTADWRQWFDHLSDAAQTYLLPRTQKIREEKLFPQLEDRSSILPQVVSDNSLLRGSLGDEGAKQEAAQSQAFFDRIRTFNELFIPNVVLNNIWKSFQPGSTDSSLQTSGL